MQKGKKIVLIIPNSRWFGKRPWLIYPYAVLIISSILKDKYEFSILDANGGDLDEDECFKRLLSLYPDVVMVSGGSAEYYKEAHLALSIAKRSCPGAITILGGVYATTLPEEAVKDENVDWVFMYHAEDRVVNFLELLFSDNFEELKKFGGIAYRDVDGKMVENSLSNRIGNVATMVKPDYSLADIRPYLMQDTIAYQVNSDKPTAFIITSYGCPFNCNFCASRTITGRLVGYRPVEDVLDEIEYLMREYGVRNFVLLDDSLLDNRVRIKNFLNTFIDRKYEISWKAASVSGWHLSDEVLELMKKSGCEQITISVESGSQRVLKEVIHKPLNLDIVPGIVKKCRDLGIDIGANFVIGSPGETWDEIRQTFKFAEECDFDVAHFHIATPLPRTDLYRISKEKGYLPEDFSFLDPKFFGFGQGFITTDEFTPLELSIVRAFEWDRINFSTFEKIKRVARLYKTTVEELNEHRKQTRRKIGIHFKQK